MPITRANHITKTSKITQKNYMRKSKKIPNQSTKLKQKPPNSLKKSSKEFNKG